MSDTQLRWDALRSDVLACSKCADLVVGRQSVVFGSGSPGARALFVGEAPGAQEDASGEPFVGTSGRLLDRLLDEVGLPRDQVAVSNVVKCRPPANRTPTRGEVANCQGWLAAQLEVLEPKVICTLGTTAAAWAFGRPVKLVDVRGRTHDRDGGPVVPTYHPAAALRGGPQGPVMQALRSDLALVARLAHQL